MNKALQQYNKIKAKHKREQKEITSLFIKLGKRRIKLNKKIAKHNIVGRRISQKIKDEATA